MTKSQYQSNKERIVGAISKTFGKHSHLGDLAVGDVVIVLGFIDMGPCKVTQIKDGTIYMASNSKNIDMSTSVRSRICWKIQEDFDLEKFQKVLSQVTSVIMRSNQSQSPRKAEE